MFLKDYTQLRQGSSDEAQLVYIRPDADFASYDQVIIDPITIWRREGSNPSKVPPDDLQMLADHLYVALKIQLQDDYTIVDRPGSRYWFTIGR